jgi:hypothetical protein
MSARIAKLEGLLSRLQSRASTPRPLGALATANSAAGAPASVAPAQVAPAPVVELDEPTLESQSFDAPELDAPELDAPELDTPELDAPELDAPDLDAPDLDELEPPSLDEPALDSPELEDEDPNSASIEMGAPESMDMDALDELDDLDEIDEVDIDEGLPESGPVSANIDDAMAAAEHQPPLTPPPESGEGLTTPHIPPRGGPTMEQLGQTISLDEGRNQHFDLDEPSRDERPDPASSQFEMEIPGSIRPQAQELAAPPEAREELERHRLGDITPIEARVSTRPVLSTNVVDLVSASKSFEPKSFLELLDASLELK